MKYTRKIRQFLRNLGIRFLTAVAGIPLVDQRTGERIGRVAILPWRGRLWVVGDDVAFVRPGFLPQARLTYWVREMGFSSHPPPDFPNVREVPSPGAGPDIEDRTDSGFRRESAAASCLKSLETGPQ